MASPGAGWGSAGSAIASIAAAIIASGRRMRAPDFGAGGTRFVRRGAVFFWAAFFWVVFFCAVFFWAAFFCAAFFCGVVPWGVFPCVTFPARGADVSFLAGTFFAAFFATLAGFVAEAVSECAERG